VTLLGGSSSSPSKFSPRLQTLEHGPGKINKSLPGLSSLVGKAEVNPAQ
jgi:hypothetical protein